MPDEAGAGLWKGRGLRAVCAVTTELSRHAREAQRAFPTSASLLAQALTAVELISALQLGKGLGRVSLQLECDGPLRGLFSDADGSGGLRGYAKNALVDVVVDSADFHWRPALGNRGFLSVLREQKEGDFFRSSVELTHFDLARDLAHFFEVSEQIDTVIALDVIESPGEALAAVGGLAVQPLPGTDRTSLAAVRSTLADGAFRHALGQGAGAAELLQRAIPKDELELTARFGLAYRCHCSKERVVGALAAMGRAEIEDVLRKEGKAEATCQFCAARYEVSGEELKGLLLATV
jgi:molecular chaperone Hsp33